MIPLTDACEARIRHLFPAVEDRAEVERLLINECGDNLRFYKVIGKVPAGYDRIRFAVMKLAGADIAKFRKTLEWNKKDWRDTLMAAGFAHSITKHQEWLSGEISSD